jgi:hypothetical protein
VTWRRPADVRALLQRRWDAGEFLRLIALDGPWEPVEVGLRPPSSRELAEDFQAARVWAGEWENHARRHRLVLRHRAVGGRLVGVNRVPAAVVVERPEDVWALLGVGAEAAVFGALVEQCRATRPALVAWVAAHPHRALRHAPVWPQVLAAVDLLVANGSAAEAVSGSEITPAALHARQLEVPGADTKFVERHRALLARLLDVVRAAEAADAADAGGPGAPGLGLAGKPAYLRARRLDGEPLLPGGGPAELGLRVEDLALHAVPCTGVIVVENEISYLTLPAVADVVAIYGEGYAASRVARVGWLGERALAYWGDIDTHGLAILDQVRATFAGARSLMMDAATLLAHEAQWTREPVQTVRVLDHLSSEEAELYRDLVEHTYGPAVRLEQERITGAAVERALAGWRSRPG